ncbi:oxidoreductase-like protein [Myxozyma melibiosi]|uniref:Oxidoreductase-like protein n=1 Tax=Myxozyma melibiosi TaxID=54550 RepID=A0ABR1F8V6_9ASCO
MTLSNPTTLRIGVVGAGRMGRIHIENLLTMPRVQVTAVCTVVPSEIAWATSVLTAPSALVTADFDTFLALDSVDAVLLVTPTAFHKEQVLKALAAGKHVLCEKPLCGTPADAWEVYSTSLTYPHLKVACAFPRRYGALFVDARARIANGEIGDIISIHSRTTDLYQNDEFLINYIKHSGGIFVDCNIHDIDICLYLLGRDAKPATAYATGTAVVFPQFDQFGDVDDGMGLVSFEDRKTVFSLYGSRDNRHGHHSRTEIIGTKGRLLLNGQPRLLQLDISDENGTRMIGPKSHMEVFAPAFRLELEGFRDWILDDVKPHFDLKDAAKAVSIGFALMESLRENKVAQS